MKLRLSNYSFIALGMVCALFIANPCFAQESSEVYSADIQQRIQELRKLKDQNPGEFQRIVSERKQKIKEEVAHLKASDPQKYEQIRQNVFEQRRQKLQRIKSENPERFQQLVENKRQRLSEFKQKNPQAYERFIQKHPHLQSRTQLAGSNPERAAKKRLPERASVRTVAGTTQKDLRRETVSVSRAQVKQGQAKKVARGTKRRG